MYKLKKGGVIRIAATEAEAKRWKGLGYEIVRDESATVEPSGIEADPLKLLSAEDLRAFAVENGVDIGNSTSQTGIYKKIRDKIPFESTKPEA
jgi:hypothetical protein